MPFEKKASQEAIDDKIVNLIREDWGQLRRVGILRFLKGTLKAGRRTAAFYYESLSKYMKRFEPKLVSEHGLVGFHLQVGLRTPIWKVETIGKRDSWSTESLDRLAGLISYLTIHDNPKMKPLPLWFAEQLVRMPKEVLISYLKWVQFVSLKANHITELLSLIRVLHRCGRPVKSG